MEKIKDDWKPSQKAQQAYDEWAESQDGKASMKQMEKALQAVDRMYQFHDVENMSQLLEKWSGWLGMEPEEIGEMDPDEVWELLREGGHDLPGDKKELEAFISTANQQLYHIFRGKISTGDFNTDDHNRWPTTMLNGSKLSGKAYIQPEDEGLLFGDDYKLKRELMKKKVQDLTKTGDLAADVFDIMTSKWLRDAAHYEAMINITADEILEARDIKKKKGGTGRRGGYREKQRQEIQKQIDTLSYTWITVDQMEVVNDKRKKETTVVESKAVVVTSRAGQVSMDGTVDAFAWRLRPGDAFSKFLFGPGRQTALLSTKALSYDPYRQKWEKRLARYFAWLWRVSEKRSREGVTVKSLIDAAGEKVNQRYPNRTRDRLEQALDQLLEDGVVSGWQYENMKEDRYTRRGWWREWLNDQIIVTAPEAILQHYNGITTGREKQKKRIEQAKKAGSKSRKG